ncbi:nitrous oxide reductase accessory protein NosL [Halogeometricum borinquense]|uniref:nitrous oxide reductase accessory protein NosL n=1 Tax=Halogeometricum borinquense TaxID=60847 RepID=UPI0034220D26
MCDQRPADDGNTFRRRHFLLASAGVGAASLAGCLGGNEGGGDGGQTTAPTAVTIPEGATCEVCGMNIRQNPGPITEIFYQDKQPNGHDNPARFDSVWEAYQYEFEKDDAGWTDVAFYVTDYSSIEYRTFEEGGDTFISSNYESSAFVPATEVTYVVDSSVKGAMGRDLVPFSKASDAESFQSEFGGSLATHDEVTPEVIAGIGR